MTTLALQPNGLTAINFSTTGRIPYGFYVPLDSLEFNEAERREFIYSETRYGGKAVNEKLNLTDVNFICFVVGRNRQEMLQLSNQLNITVTYPLGGELAYKPDGASITSYYTYEASAVPAVAQIDHNHWDEELTKEGGLYVMAFNVTLKTHPLNHSAVQTLSLSTGQITNGDGGNFFNVSDIKGNVPAIIHLAAQNSSNGQSISRIYLCSRSAIYANYASTMQFEAENGTVIGSWSNQSDAARSGGAYRRTTLNTTDWIGIKFPLSSPQAYQGLLAHMVVIKPSLTTLESRVAVYVGSERVWTSEQTWTPTKANAWQVLYVGEYNFPPFALVPTTTGAYIAVEFRATNGSPTLDFDFMQLMWSDEAIQQIDVGYDQSYGMSYGQKTYVAMGLDYKRFNYVAANDNTYLYPVRNTYGTLGLTAIQGARLHLLWERINTNDLHNADDTMDLMASIIYRSTYPFD